MDDLVSRQAAIDAHCELCGDRWLCNGDICPDVEVFQLLPSVQPERKWISVTEELPKEKGEYMVTVEYLGWHGEKGRMLTSARYTKTKGWRISNGKVTAWMLLPEPWKGEDDE